MTATPPPALKIGLMLDRNDALDHLRTLVEWARARSEVEIVAVVVHGRAPARATHRLSALALRGIARAEAMVLRRTYRGHVHRHDSAALAPMRLEIAAPRRAADGALHFDGDAVASVRGLGLDVLLGFGSAVIAGDMTRAAALGTLWMRYGSNGAAPAAGFRECLRREPATAFAIERLDGRRQVAAHGRVGTRISFLENQAHLYRKADVHLRALLLRMAATRAAPALVAPVTTDAAPASPALSQLAGYTGRMLMRLAVKGTQRALRFRRRFGISILQRHWRDADLREAVEVFAPRGRFWADPFLWTGPDGRVVCFVEDYVYATGRAHISALQVDGNCVTDLGPVIVEPYHLSFPFLFAHEGTLYMCPECSGSGQIRVYRCTGFPLQWELAAVLMENVSAADTMLFPRDGRWWMLTSIDAADVKDHCSELFLFSGPSPLGQAWTPCAANPVRIDPAGGRNAGLAIEGERVYRFAQRQGFDRYGEGLIVYEVMTVSDTGYAEREVARIEPDFGRRLIGSHHMTTTGEVTVVDHVRREFVF